MKILGRFETWQWMVLTAYLVILNVVIGMLIFTVRTSNGSALAIKDEYTQPSSEEMNIRLTETIVTPAPRFLSNALSVRQSSLDETHKRLRQQVNQAILQDTVEIESFLSLEQASLAVNATAVDILPDHLDQSSSNEAQKDLQNDLFLRMTPTPPAPFSSVRTLQNRSPIVAPRQGSSIYSTNIPQR